jgi:lysozyme family protein
MGNFETAYEKMLKEEGCYVNDSDDPGGETYKGISRKMWGGWDGWALIDILKKQTGFPGNIEKDNEIQEKVSDFYHNNYWLRIKGDEIENGTIACSIFDFAVNAGVTVSSSLAQMVVKVEVDGVIGNITLKALNEIDPEKFTHAFTIAKIARYVNIIKKRPGSQKYFFGWVLRSLESM